MSAVLQVRTFVASKPKWKEEMEMTLRSMVLSSTAAQWFAN
jgi:hypothetical protein